MLNKYLENMPLWLIMPAPIQMQCDPQYAGCFNTLDRDAVFSPAFSFSHIFVNLKQIFWYEMKMKGESS